MKHKGNRNAHKFGETLTLEVSEEGNEGSGRLCAHPARAREH